MLSEAVKARINDWYRALRATGLRARPSQREMIAAVAQALDPDSHGRLTLIEAPTGTGKTLAYLIAALALAKETQRRLVISTATIALQQQVIEHDLPRFLEAVGEEIEVRLVKGRRRHVCDRNLMQAAGEAAGQTSLAGFEDTSAQQWGPSEREQLARMLEARRGGEWDGDMDAWPETLESQLVQGVTTGPGGCPGRRCPLAATCPSLRARTGVATAPVLVTNHALLLRDLCNPEGSLIAPEPSKVMLVCDEGHQLARVARQTLAHRIVPALAGTQVEALAGVLRSVGALTGRHIDIATSLSAWRAGAAELARTLDAVAGAQRDQARALEEEQRQAVAEPLRHLIAPTSALLDAIATAAKATTEHLANAPSEQQTAAGQILDRLSRQRVVLEECASVAEQVTRADLHTARWFEPAVGGALALAATQLDTGAVLAPLLGKLGGTVLTSATLQRLGSFRPLEHDLGMRAAATLALPSPFDLAAQGELRVVSNAPAPREEEAHTEAVVSAIEEHHAPGEGTLVLFASHRQMNAVAERLPEGLRERVRLQSDGAVAMLLVEHAQDVAQGRTAILMGVASFAEGLDLPGAQCRALVIAKLPFAVPDDPIERARARVCEADGGNAFAQVALPDTHLRLTQALGRLIRTETDHGWMVVVDARLTATRYGRTLLAHLPPFAVRSIELAPRPAAARVARARPSRAVRSKSTSAPVRGKKAPRLHQRKGSRPLAAKAPRAEDNGSLFAGA